MTKRITLKTIAQHAGVSVGTVSNVLNGKPNVSSELREAVLSAARELGYPYAGRAIENSSLVTVFGLSIKNQYATATQSVSREVRKTAESKGIQLIEYDNENDVEQQILQIDEMIDRKMEAILFTPVKHDAFAETVSRCKRQNIPIISLTRRLTGVEATATFSADNYHAGRDLALYITTKLGQRPGKILEIRTEAGDLNGTERHAGFVDGIAHWPWISIVDSANMVWSKHEAWGGAYEITRRALKKHKDINVIFCHVDEAFEAVIRALADCGRLYPCDSPDHVMLVGVDGSPTALEYIRQGYADCVSEQPIIEMAVMAVEAAIEAMKYPFKPLSSRFLPTQLVTAHNIDCAEHWGKLFVEEAAVAAHA
mgnify:CR=1 FL=1